MKQITEIRKAFPNQQVIELNNGTGCNIHFDFATVTVWFKKQKYGNVNGWFKYNVLGEFIADMDRYINPPKKVAHIEPQAIPRLYAEGTAEGKRQASEMLAAIETKQTPNNVQLCIDHINRKIEYAEKNGLSATNIAMLKTLTTELIHYL